MPIDLARSLRPGRGRSAASESISNEAPADADIRQAVMVNLMRPRQEPRRERRRDERIAFPYPVRMKPAEENGEAFVVLGKQLSERGLDFYYTRPIEQTRVEATFETVDGNWISLLMKLTWCRFNRHGWYENGGRFLKVLSASVGPPGSPERFNLDLNPAGFPQRLTDRLL